MEAIILAGGRGERLRPLTEDRPKCMVDILGSPIIAYQIRWMSTYGITQFTVACGYLHEIIQEYFGDGSKLGVKIDYIVEKSPLGRGGALKQALKKTMSNAGDSVLCLNGDNICNLSLPSLFKFHEGHKQLASIVTVPLRSPYGIVEVAADDTVCGFSEKPELPYGVNAGIYVMDKKIIDLLPDVGDHEVETFPKLASQGRLKAFRSNCFWRTVDTMKDVSELKVELEQVLMGAFLNPQR
ncbi:MAG: nucleotidyltransferase family protein [Candidatus Obscuribacterales bacterium]|nr:nucleotidyltransferase family protein [Candidatus Obscuribacterales bacterium]